tara:strand:+ start:953 stop:2560 length:1608 start_codon:yes stop_codon:yes gene_type:complete
MYKMLSNFLLKVDNSKNIIFILSALVSTSILFRFLYFPYEIPVFLDSIGYFYYAYEITQTGNLPSEYFANNGWPAFLSLFFSLVEKDNFFDFVYVQRSIAIIISSITAIPIFFLCKKFVETKYAIIAAIVFTFSPRLVLNSIQGLSEPLTIFLFSMTLVLLLNNKMKYTFVAFTMSSLLVLVRSELLLVIIPLSIIFFIKHKKESKVYFKFIIVISIFFLILTPMIYLKIEATGQDGLTSQFTGGISHMSERVIAEKQPEDALTNPYPEEWQNNKLENFLTRAITSLVKYVGFALFPGLILFVLLGIFLITKKWKKIFKDYRSMSLILFIPFLIIPMLYAYGRGIEESRYIFILFPIFIIPASYAVKKLTSKNYKIISLSIVLFILISSLLFIEYNKLDYNHEKESFLISKDIVNLTTVINADPIDGNYLTVAKIIQKWPDTHIEFSDKKFKYSSLGFNSINDFIIENKKFGLSHIVTDGKDHGSEFTKDIFHNNFKYPYLIKIYDSTENGYEYKVIIFEINYEIFYKTDRIMLR